MMCYEIGTLFFLNNDPEIMGELGDEFESNLERNPSKKLYETHLLI